MPATSSTTGPSGNARCSQSSSLPSFCARTAAVNAINASFANSDGCNVNGPRPIQRDAP